MIPDHYKPLRSKAWLRQLSEEDRKVFGRIGYEAAALKEINVNKIGGKARAAQAQRDHRGRFIKKSNTPLTSA